MYTSGYEFHFLVFLHVFVSIMSADHYFRVVGTVSTVPIGYM